MEPRELERRLTRKEVAPVVFLWGEESLLIDEAIQRIEVLVLDPTARDFNRDLFYGDEAEAQRIVTAAQTLPWLTAQRLVLVRRAEALPRAADPTLIAYCRKPSPSSCLIFTASKVEAGRGLFATLLKLPWVVRFRRLLPRELTTWVEQRVAAHGCRIAPKAVAGLIEATGNDLRTLASEIDKLVSFVGAGQVIGTESLAAVTGDVRETSAFELARLLTARDLAGALRAWEKFSSSGDYPGMALGAIIHQVRQLWRLKLMQHAGATPERIAAELNIPPFMVQRLSTQARGLDGMCLRQWLEALSEADQQLKRSGLAPQSVFARLMLRFCLESEAAHACR